MDNILVRSDEKREIEYLAVLSHLTVSYNGVFFAEFRSPNRFSAAPLYGLSYTSKLWYVRLSLF